MINKRLLSILAIIFAFALFAFAGPGADSEIMHEIAEEAYDDEPASWHGLTIHFWIGAAPFILVGIIALIINIIHKARKGLGLDD